MDEEQGEISEDKARSKEPENSPETSASKQLNPRRLMGPQVKVGRMRRAIGLAMLLSQLGQLSLVASQQQQVATEAGEYRSELREERDLDQEQTPLTASTDSSCPSHTIGHKPEQSSEDTKKIFCFYDIQDELRPQELNPCLCSHVVYSYVAMRKNLSFIAGKKGKFAWVRVQIWALRWKKSIKAGELNGMLSSSSSSSERKFFLCKELIRQKKCDFVSTCRQSKQIRLQSEWRFASS